MAATTLVIDKSHSEALFTVRHLITNVCRHFGDFEGIIQMDEGQPERSSVSVIWRPADSSWATRCA